jgi:hypothetical protein
MQLAISKWFSEQEFKIATNKKIVPNCPLNKKQASATRPEQPLQ